MRFLAGDATASLPGIRLLLDLIASADGVTMDRTEVASLLAPAKILPSSDAVLESCIRVAKRLGLVEVTERRELTLGRVAVDQGRETFASPEIFAQFFRRVLREESRESLHEGESASDLMKGICWFLSLDPLQPLPWGFSNPITEKSIVSAIGITNPAPYRALRRWGQQLGYIVESQCAGESRITPTPWNIVAAELPERGTYPARALFDELKHRLPEFPGGEIGGRVIANADHNEPEMSHHRCMQALEVAERVQMSASPDAAGPNRVAVQSVDGVKSIDNVVVL